MTKIKFYSLWLCLICIIIFILQLIFPVITDFGILNKSALYNYEFWRFLTSIFLHGSITHLLYNLFALALFGIILEKLIGSKKFLLVFFSSGIIANIISVSFYNSSLGASGAIMGIIGALAIIRPLMMVWAFGLILPMFIAAILWIAGDVLGSLGAFKDNIGYLAHLSGVGVGFIIGLILRLQKSFSLISDSAQEQRFLTEWRTTKKQLIRIPEGYMKIWENNYMR